jgi:arabinogalactan oligomer/maltooligosaccharide transport system permease protein
MTSPARTIPATIPATPETKAVAKVRTSTGGRLPLGKQLLLQLACLFIALTVLFPIAWIVGMSINPSNIAHPKDLVPPGATLDAYNKVIQQPTQNPVSFAELAFNSFKLAAGTSLLSVLIGVSAAYAFSRFRFGGREPLMLGILGVLMLPSVATIAPLFVMLNKVVIGDFNLRNSLWGVGLAILSGLLPFAIWNLKGYLDTIPKELEEAAILDGANSNQVFVKIILPLSTPALAVTAFLGFLGGWTEFALSWQFLNNPKDFTLGMTLNGMVGQFATTTPWSQFAAMAILVALPVSVVYLFLQRYIVSGLTIGGVKG